MHLRIWLQDKRLDYVATAAAARNLMHELWSRHSCKAELVQDAADGNRALPRLPCERLFLGP